MIKKFGFIILVLVAVVYLTGCGKKKTAEESMSMDELGILSGENVTVTETKPQPQVSAVQAPVVTETKSETLPTIEPYKPSTQEIQTALKNAGYYTGPIDGKIGPLSSKAIEEFQKANGLKVDGKVGLRTWAVLSKYLNAVSMPSQSGTKNIQP